METSLIISIISVLIALISAVISGFSIYINTTDRRLKDNPFFVYDSNTFESSFPSKIMINPINYNFIYASLNKEELYSLKHDSIKAFKNKVNISKEKTYLKLYNAGGIGKDLNVQTTIKVPVHQMKTSKIYKSGYWDIEFEGENDDWRGEYTLFTSNRQNESITRIPFDSEYKIESPYKGITADGYINILVPKEFILFTNLYIQQITKEPPQLIIKIKGKNVYNKKFDDSIRLAIERFKTIDSDKERVISVGIRGVYEP